MAEAKTAPTAPAAVESVSGKAGKMVVVVGVDDSEHSYYALEWTVRHVAAGAELVVVHAKPPPSSSVISFGGPGAGEAMRCVEADLRKMAEAVVERARRVCIANSTHALIEVIEGEPGTSSATWPRRTMRICWSSAAMATAPSKVSRPVVTHPSGYLFPLHSCFRSLVRAGLFWGA